MKILNSLLIIGSDLGITNNPLGLEEFFGLSTGLLSNFLFSTDSFQTYIDSDITRTESIWVNGEAFPFLVKETMKNYAMTATNSSFIINAMSTTNSNSLFRYTDGTNSMISINDDGILLLDETKGFGKFVLNDSSAIEGYVLNSNNGYAYWDKPQAKLRNFYATLVYEDAGLSNLRSYVSQFSFNNSNVISLTYSVLQGSVYNPMFVISGLTSSFISNHNIIDVYHNLNNTYSIVDFWGYSASCWQHFYPNKGLTGVSGTFSYTVDNNKIRISLTGSLPSVPWQIHVVG